MTGPDVDTLLDRALADAEFLTQLLARPREAAASLGVTLSDDEVETFRAMSAEDVRSFAADHRASSDPDRRRAAC